MYKSAIISYCKEKIGAVGILQKFWYIYLITHSAPKLFTNKYPYAPETHSISIPVQVTNSMKVSRTKALIVFTFQCYIIYTFPADGSLHCQSDSIWTNLND